MSGKEEVVNAATVVINNIGTKFGVVNTGLGAKNSDGSVNVSGLAQGTAATGLAYAHNNRGSR